MTHEILNIIGAFTGGLALGIIFFGGLWFTVKKAVGSKIPALWIFSSFILRISITMTGFYFIGAGDWVKLLACLVGFIVSRIIVLHFTKSIDEKQVQVKKELGYEA